MAAEGCPTQVTLKLNIDDREEPAIQRTRWGSVPPQAQVINPVCLQERRKVPSSRRVVVKEEVDQGEERFKQGLIKQDKKLVFLF